MSIKVTGTGQGLSRTTNLPNHNSAYTMMAWVNLTSISGASGTYRGIFDIDGGSGANTGDVLYMTGDGAVPTMYVNNSGSSVGSTPINVTNWYHMTMVRESATRLLGYANAVLNCTVTTNVAARAATTQMAIGQALSTSSGEDFQSGQFEDVRIWRRALTLSEIRREMASAVPYNRGGLVGQILAQTPDEYLDYAVGGRWAVTGTLSRGAPITAYIPWPRRRRVLNATGATAYTMPTTVGAFTLTGVATGLAFGHKIAAATGSYTLTGNATGFVRGHPMPTTVGVFTLTGNASALTAQRKLTMAAGAFTLTGVDAGLTYTPASAVLTATTASYTLTGNATGLTVQRKLATAVGTFTETGVAAGLTTQRRLATAVGAYTLTGVDVTLTYTPVAGAYTLTTESAAFVLTGNDTALSYQAAVTAPPAGGGYVDYSFFADYESHRRRKRKQEEDEREAQAEADEIQKDIDRKIAKLLREQEARDAAQAELKRVQALADRYAGTKQPVSRRVAAALLKAQEERTRNSLEQLSREIERMLEEEEIAVIHLLLND